MQVHPLLARQVLARQVSPVLVGRDDLLALAARRWRDAAAGTGHLLLLAGEAGIGKTRLLTEIVARATTPTAPTAPAAPAAPDDGAAGARVFVGGCFPADTEIAGGLLADLAVDLRRAAPGPGQDAGARIAERLRHADSNGDAHRRRRMLVADLADAVLSIAPTGGTAGAAGTAGPVLLALEDLHWADDVTLDVLERVARRLAGCPMLLVATYRSDELFPKAPIRAVRARLLNQRLAEEARLGRLDAGATTALVAALASQLPSAALSRAVFERSDGIPLHIEEFAAAAASGGTGAAGEEAQPLPDTLADAVRGRAEALSPPARRVASAAAVIGREFELDLLTAVVDDPPGDVDDALQELHDRFFVLARGDGATFDFRHALIRDALHADVPPHRRRDLHRRVAEAGAAHGLADAHISDHYERARQPAPAHAHALRAAAAAVQLSAHREAVGLYRRAQRTTPSGTPAADRADLLAALAGELAAIDDNTAAAAAYTEAHDLRRGTGDEEGAARLVPKLVAVRHLLGAPLAERTAELARSRARVTDPATVAELDGALAAAYMLDRRLDEALRHSPDGATLGSVLVFAGRMDEGWQLLHDATTSAERAGAEAEAARAYRMIGTCASVLVEYDLATHWLRAGIGYAERTERFNDRHYMTAHLGHVRWATGDLDEAERLAKQSKADGEGGITTLITALLVLGYVALARGEHDTARQHLTEALALAEPMNELQRISPALWGLAETALHSGNPDPAWSERGYAASREVRDAAYLFPHVVTGVRAYLATGDRAAAGDWAARGTALLLERNIPGTLPAVDHAAGLLHLHDGQTGKARDALERARAGWDERRRRWEGTQVLLDLARCATRSRRPGEAAALTARARARGAAEPAPTGDDPGPLTARELEVARLIAAGHTNREIGGLLHIAPKTVAAHVEHILTKLGVGNRARVAAWVTGLRG